MLTEYTSCSRFQAFKPSRYLTPCCMLIAMILHLALPQWIDILYAWYVVSLLVYRSNPNALNRPGKSPQAWQPYRCRPSCDNYSALQLCLSYSEELYCENPGNRCSHCKLNIEASAQILLILETDGEPRGNEHE